MPVTTKLAKSGLKKVQKRNRRQPQAPLNRAARNLTRGGTGTLPRGAAAEVFDQNQPRSKRARDQAVLESRRRRHCQRFFVFVSQFFGPFYSLRHGGACVFGGPDAGMGGEVLESRTAAIGGHPKGGPGSGVRRVADDARGGSNSRPRRQRPQRR